MRRQQTLCAENIEKTDTVTVEDERLFTYLLHQKDMAWMLAPDTTGLWFNDIFYNMTGKTLAQMRQWAWQDFLPTDEIPRVADGFYRCFATGEPWQDMYHLRVADGTYRPVLARGAPVRNSEGKIRFWVGTLIDMTDCSSSAFEAKVLKNISRR